MSGHRTCECGCGRTPTSNRARYVEPSCRERARRQRQTKSGCCRPQHVVAVALSDDFPDPRRAPIDATTDAILALRSMAGVLRLIADVGPTPVAAAAGALAAEVEDSVARNFPGTD